ncbi:RNA polymerase sigma factor [Dermabacteraceae bacterium P7074]
MSSENGARDRHLVLRSQDGDAEAFGQLVDIYQARLFRTAFMILGNRQDTEDVVQETFILAWKRIHLLENPDAFRGWLRKICTHRATDAVRRQARRATSAQPGETLEALDVGPDTNDPGRAVPPADPAHTSEVNAKMSALARVLSTLKPELRACWVLKEVEEMSYQEIAQNLNLSESTVRGRIARSRTRIMERMEEWR